MRARPLLLLSIIILSCPVFAVAAEEDEPPPLPILDAGTAVVEIGARSAIVGYALTPLGPVVALDPLVRSFGGELRLGPLGQSHELTLEGTTWVFGPDSSVLAAGEELTELSQRPVVGAHGLQVPIDLLAAIYGELQGYEFRWDPGARRLVVERRPQREVPVEVDLVHLQGVTTVVLQFDQQPRYRIREAPGVVTVELLGDRLRAGARPPAADRLVPDIRFGSASIRLGLAGDAVAKSYVLQQPFRIVFDVYRDTRARLPQTIAPTPPRRGGGLRTIVIDPGHGGSDTGAAGSTGLLEKDLTLTIARSLRSELARRLPVKVVLTRDEDAELPPDTRAALANQQKADLFISLHLNSGPDSRAQGAETYFSSPVASDADAARTAALENQAGDGDPLDDLALILWDLAQSHYLAESQRLASLIQEELNQALGLRNRGVKQAPFRVLVGAAMPAVLVELGFLTNAQEERRLQDPSYRAQLTEALVRAVLRYRAAREERISSLGEGPP